MSEICLATGLECIKCNPGACDHRKTKPNININDDLISRNALIRDMYEDGTFPLDVADKALKKIEAQPIAYNVAKVIEQIRENSFNSGYKPPITKISTNKAVEIIKAGGLNE